MVLRHGACLADAPLTFDFWSAITHELGHGMGFGSFTGEGFPGHFSTGDSPCPADRNLWNTMCTPQNMNETFWRTLASHDSHTFDNRY